MFNKNAATEMSRIIKSCADYQILCKVGENEQPSVVVAGQDPAGRKWVVTTNIDEAWVREASCSGQFIAQVVEQIRTLRGASSESIYADRAEVLSRVFLQGTLLPLLDRD